MRTLRRQVQSPRLRPWQARGPYAVAGLVILMAFGVALVETFRRGGSTQQLTETAAWSER